MAWRVIKRRLGRAGGERERLRRQRDWDREHGEGLWAIGYLIDGAFVSQDEAFDLIYVASYADYFDAHPAELEALASKAKALRNPHAEATTGVDLQVPAILAILRARGFELCGAEVVDIGTWNEQASHAISIRLSPLQIPCHGFAKLTLEKFWQSKKCLAVWIER